MIKLNFNEVRGFNDSITFTFHFVKKEFKPLLKTFGVIALPMVFASLFVQSCLIRNTLSYAMQPDPGMEAMWGNIQNSLWNYLLVLIGFVWMALMVLSYVRIYVEKFHQGDEKQITVKEVWTAMYPKIGVIYFWGILYFLIVLVGMFFFILPGFYFGVALLFSVYFLILRDQPLFTGMNDSMHLVKGQWWNFFGYLLVLQLLVGALSYIFSIPYTVLTFKALWTQELPGIYETTFGLMLTTLGQYLLQIILLVGIAVRFYSALEQKEHTSLLEKIELIGSNTPREEVC